VGRVLRVEESLPIRVDTGFKRGIAAARARILAVIEQHNALVGQERGRSAFGQAAVEKILPLRHRKFRHGSPITQVGGGHQMDDAFAVVEPVSALDLGGDHAAVPHGTSQ